MNDEFVMWFNYLASLDFSNSRFGVAVSKSPLGPFKVINDFVETTTYKNPGDFAILPDDDGKGYIIYTANINGN